MTNINDPEYDPSPYAHAMRHLDEAEDLSESWGDRSAPDKVIANALIGIGWALLAIARKP